MVRGLRKEYGRIVFNFQDGQKKFDTEGLEHVMTWWKTWDEDTFKSEFKLVEKR